MDHGNRHDRHVYRRWGSVNSNVFASGATVTAEVDATVAVPATAGGEPARYSITLSLSVKNTSSDTCTAVGQSGSEVFPVQATSQNVAPPAQSMGLSGDGFYVVSAILTVQGLDS